MSHSIEESYTLRKVKKFKFYFFCRVENHNCLISRCNITKGVKLPRSIRRLRSLFFSFPFFVDSKSFGAMVPDAHTSSQPSFNTLDMFLMWLYRNEKRIPFLQERACWILNLMPHSHVDSSLVSVRPNLMQIRSQNNCLGKTKPSPERGTDVNQLEAPCSLFNSLRRF